MLKTSKGGAREWDRHLACLRVAAFRKRRSRLGVSKRSENPASCLELGSSLVLENEDESSVPLDPPTYFEYTFHFRFRLY